jgi:SAM-dependent methyltransferase
MNLRELERESIRAFIQYCADEGTFHENDVLDYGCGKQPYRDIIVFGGGRYHGYDLEVYPANVSEADIQEPEMFDRMWNVIVCTQVVQYVPDVPTFLQILHALLVPGGQLVITWPTNWPEVEREDLHRFTASGMARLMHTTGFREFGVSPRAFVELGAEKLYRGHGGVAWK